MEQTRNERKECEARGDHFGYVLRQSCGLHVITTGIIDGGGFPSCGTGLHSRGCTFLRFETFNKYNNAAFNAPQQIYPLLG